MLFKDSWKEELRSGYFSGIPIGYAWEGVTYSKGAPIFFVSDDGNEVRRYISEMKKIEESDLDTEERIIAHQALEETFPGVFVVYLYDKINSSKSERYEEGFLFWNDSSRSYVRVPNKNLRTIKGYVYL